MDDFAKPTSELSGNHVVPDLTALDSTASNNIQAPTDSVSGDVLTYTTEWVADPITNANVDAAAAIAYSKLALSDSILDADIKTTAAISATKLKGYPTDATKFLRGDDTWAVPTTTPPNPTWAGVFSPDNAGHTWQTANAAILHPFELYAASTMVGISINIGVSSGNLDVGIYNAAGTRLCSSGATASPGTGWRTINFSSPTSIPAGRHWLAVAVNNTTFNITVHNGMAYVQRIVATSYPLPASIAPGTTVPSPIICLHAAIP